MHCASYLKKLGDIQKERLSDSNMQNKSIKDIQENNVQPKAIQNGVIVHADLLLEYLKKNYSNLYFVSSTTKVLTNFQDFLKGSKKRRFSIRCTGFSSEQVF